MDYRTIAFLELTSACYCLTLITVIIICRKGYSGRRWDAQISVLYRCWLCVA